MKIKRFLIKVCENLTNIIWNDVLFSSLFGIGVRMYIEIKPSFVGTYIEILSSLRIFGGFYHEWYVGLTSDSKHSFIEVHKLDLLRTDWILSNKTDMPVLGFLKKIFVQMGCRNDTSLDMSYSDQIYLFKI